MDRIGTNGWRTIFGVVAAVCSFLLIQTDQPIEGWAKVIIGAVSVALAVISPDQWAKDEP
jgi:hypothetical protein